MRSRRQVVGSTARGRGSAFAAGADPGRATEVPVFFVPTESSKDGALLGLFQGYSLLDGAPTEPDQMPRITLFFDTLAQAANYRRGVFLREVRITYLHELGHYLGWDEEQIANVGLA